MRNLFAREKRQAIRMQRCKSTNGLACISCFTPHLQVEVHEGLWMGSCKQLKQTLR